MLDLLDPSDEGRQLGRHVVPGSIPGQHRVRRIAVARQNPQVGQQLPRALVAPRRILGQTLEDDPFEVSRQIGIAGDHRVGIGMANPVHDCERCLAGERQPAGRGLIQEHAKRKEVGPVIDHRPDRLLGAHVGGRAHDDVRRCHRCACLVLGSAAARRRELREPEVQHLHLCRGRDHDVRRLHVAMDDTDGMRCLQRFGDLAAGRYHVPGGERSAAQLVGQGSAVHVLHRDEVPAFALADVVDDGDVGMGERRGRTCLLNEARQLLGGEAPVGAEQLERDPAVQARVVGEKHFAHAAGAKRRQHLIPPERGARLERH